MSVPRRAVLRALPALALPASLLSCAAPTAVAVGALDFTGRTLDAASFDGATLAGSPAVLWFWAPF